MSEQPETIYAIVAEMREAGRSDEHADGPLIEDYADRLERAVALERIELREDEAKMLLREYAAAPDESLTPSAMELKRELLRLAPAPGNAAALREALEKIAEMKFHLGDFAEPVGGDSSAIYENAKYDGKKFLGREIPAWWGAGWRECLSRAIDTARAALSAPARNCDRFKTADEARRAFESAHSHGIVHNLYTAAFDWLFDEAEGGDHA